MKLNVLLWVMALLSAFLPRSADCRPDDAPTSRRPLFPRPLLLHLGEEFSLRLGGGGGFSSAAAPDLLSSSSSYSMANRAVLQLTQRLLQARAEHRREQEVEVEEEEAREKGKRSEEPPISLDLTFHLLREVLEMARAEQIAQQADSNRKMMDDFGK
ncbi:corticoliberin-1-like [Epinephelus fuscoguttatus]|uniref:corticoliberin-1-like n=1 Tax=Epinephelus fuscoguttatus TaxID=293821 RepID=UPI0020D12045|nr:corticoliberin-1-like [Epinephelus fuscoguttatus]